VPRHWEDDFCAFSLTTVVLQGNSFMSSRAVLGFALGRRGMSQLVSSFAFSIFFFLFTIIIIIIIIVVQDSFFSLVQGLFSLIALRELMESLVLSAAGSSGWSYSNLSQ
jgi:hypothetical protein